MVAIITGKWPIGSIVLEHSIVRGLRDYRHSLQEKERLEYDAIVPGKLVHRQKFHVLYCQ